MPGVSRAFSVYGGYNKFLYLPLKSALRFSTKAFMPSF